MAVFQLLISEKSGACVNPYDAILLQLNGRVFSAQKFQIRAESYKFVLLLHGITNDSKTEA